MHFAKRADAAGLALTTAIPSPSPSPALATSRRDPSLAPVALVRGPSPHLASETDSLRRGRLRAAAVFMIVTVGIFTTWRLATGSPRDLTELNLATMLGLGLVVTVLGGARPISPARLKGIEAATFGLMGAFVAVRQYLGIVAAGRDNGPDVLTAGLGALHASTLLMVVYAMLIPNTWRAAARVVLAFAALPTATIGMAWATYPEVFFAIAESTRFEIITQSLLLSLVTAGLAIYGAHVINSLRSEAFAARQLNQYRLVTLLGRGGMGDVYLAEHRMMKRPCALKLIRPEKAGNPRSLARFEREVQATARLSHPNTIEIYDFGCAEDGTFYYVMEYLPGLSLQDLVDDHGPMPPCRAVYLLRQACGALAEAHASGLIHRDLKPANIIAASRGGKHDVAKLVDFGLVKEVAVDPHESTVQGTPLYMAPEQAYNRPDIDHRIDLYALGGIGYFLVTGLPPFERASRIDVLTAHANDPVIPPRRLNPEVPADLERIILRCLAKDPADRYPDADALERDLAACSCAGAWDVQAAELWWQSHEPALFDARDDRPPMTPIDTPNSRPSR